MKTNWRTIAVLMTTMCAILFIALVHDGTVQQPTTKWLPLNYYDWNAMDRLGDVYACWPEDADSLPMDSIAPRIDELNDYVEAHHDMMSRGISIYIQDALIEIADEHGIVTMDYEPIPIDMFAAD